MKATLKIKNRGLIAIKPKRRKTDVTDAVAPSTALKPSTSLIQSDSLASSDDEILSETVVPPRPRRDLSADFSQALERRFDKWYSSEHKARVTLSKAFDFDKPLFVAATLLSLIGLIFIYSASSYSAAAQMGDAFHYVKTQAAALAIGLFLAIALSFFDVCKLRRFGWIALLLSYVVLALVFVPVLGVESYGAKRWLNLGLFTLQPSEYAKFGLVIFFASFMCKADMSRFTRVLCVLAAGALMCVLLLLEPNMSITIVVAAVMFVMMFVGGAQTKHLLMLAVPALIFAVVLIVAEPYRMQRLAAFLNPWESPLDEGYQLIQSYYALGSGGLFGVGLFNSRQKFMFLPFAESDFILSIIGEETGIFGIASVLLLFAVVVWRGIVIALRAKDRFSCYLAAGISAVVAVQTIINAAVVSGAVPPTGLPLPFVSAGGSSLVAYLAAVGLLLSISRHNRTFALDGHKM